MKLNCMKKKMLFPMFSQVHSSKIQGGPNCFCRSSSEFPCSEQPTSPVFSINAVSFYVEQTVTRGRGQNNVCPECRVQPCERDTSFRAKKQIPIAITRVYTQDANRPQTNEQGRATGLLVARSPEIYTE